MNVKEKLELITSVGEETIGKDELLELIKDKVNLIAYDGFEPSGQIHIAQGLLRTITVNKLTSAGVKFKFYVADWFAMLNNKYGGDLNKIRIVGEYFIEVWRACGLDVKNVEFVWASDFIKSHPEYWETVLKLSMNSTINRVLRCGQIMGREESTNNPASQILYPLMQAADIYHLGANIAQLGMDQRKVNMLARDLFPKLGLKPPVIISHHMLMGLSEPKADKLIIDKFLSNDDLMHISEAFILKFKGIKKRNSLPEYILNSFDKEFGKKEDFVNLEVINRDGENIGGFLQQPFDAEWSQKDLDGNIFSILFQKKSNKISVKVWKVLNEFDRKIEIKMSKSKPDTAIFMTDDKSEIERKFNKAYCPEGKVEDNPVLEYMKYIVFEKFEKILIERPEKFGGDVSFNDYDSLEKAFLKKQVHPMDLKNSCAKYINDLLTPIREHFVKDKKAKKLLEQVKSFQVSR